MTNTGSSTLGSFLLTSPSVNYPCVGPATTLAAGESVACALSLPPTGAICQASNAASVTASSSVGNCGVSATDNDSIIFTRVCRLPASECDLLENCSPSGSCPTDTFAPQGTTCGTAAIGNCDQQDTCDGSGTCVDRYGSCSDGYSCTTDVCGSQRPHNCQYTPDISGCKSCTCAPAEICNPASPDAWSDGCVHRFTSTAGSILPRSPNEALASCSQKRALK